MKTSFKGCIGTAVLFCATAIPAGQPQHIDPGEVPEGITAEDWGIVQEAYVKASNTDAGDNFGASVAISGNTIVVGAWDEDSRATGVNGNQNNNDIGRSGAAYVYVRNGSTWSQQAYLKASNTDTNDRFGISVAISGDTIVVGAYLESSSATGVNGNQADNSVYHSGAAYVFVRNGTTWSQQAYLKGSNPDEQDWFGYSVAIHGDTIVVGAPNEDSSAIGTNGNQSNNSADDSGAAYVFVRNGTSWSQEAYLKASNTDEYDHFGCSVGICDNTIVVGAYQERSNATGVNGNQLDNSAGYVGAAYVFLRDRTSWNQQAYLKPSNTGGWFGASVAISSESIVVGARGERSNATGVNGDQTDISAFEAGAAYVFVRNGITWSQQAYLKASNTDMYDEFGISVAVSGNTIAVGACSERSSATGVDGDQFDNSASDPGAAYVFVRDGTTWSQQGYLKASNTDTDGYNEEFGCSVAVSGGAVVAGAHQEDSSAIGINGTQTDNSAADSGAAYVFTGFGTPESAIITDCSPVPAGIRLEWIPVAGFDSVVQCSTDLVNTPLTDLSSPLPYPVNSYTDTVVNGKCFYKVDLEP